MSTTQNLAKTNNSAPCLAEPARFLNANDPEPPARSNDSLIQWPTEQQVREVSTRLVTIIQMGARSEAAGNYFRSGDLAYRVHEIIQATAELFKKSQRPQQQ